MWRRIGTPEKRRPERALVDLGSEYSRQPGIGGEQTTIPDRKYYTDHLVEQRTFLCG